MASIPIKTPADIVKMRAAGRAAAVVLDRLAKMVAPGVTTGEIDRAAGEFMAELGCRSAFLGYRGFPAQTCISVNEEVVHGIGGSRRLAYGDLVKIDTGIILKRLDRGHRDLRSLRHGRSGRPSGSASRRSGSWRGRSPSRSPGAAW